MQPTQDEFVERDDIGEYVVKAPAPVYREMGVGSEGDEEGGTLILFPFPCSEKLQIGMNWLQLMLTYGCEQSKKTK